MKYKDFSKNHYRARRNSNGKGRPWLKSAVMIAIAAVSLFGLKMLLTPVVGSLANLYEDSSTAISYMINRGSILQDNGVTNTLLIGVDRREYLPSGTLTDTIIVASYQHQTQRISLLSLPRDLWIAEYGTKINSVYSAGGIEALKQVIEDKLGLPIHYSALTSFEGFEAAIDAIDGVDLYVERTFDDYRYPRPGYENATDSERWQHVRFEQGWQHMDGQTALVYARSRHALGPEGSDFARMQRQQNVVLAAKEKILSSETLFNLDRLRNLYLTIEEHVETNISLGELPLFYQMAKQVGDGSQVETYVLQGDSKQPSGLLYAPDPAQFGGAYVLLPREGWEKVQEFVREAVYLAPQP